MADRNSFKPVFLKVVIGFTFLSLSFSSLDALAQKENLAEHDMSLMGIEEQLPIMMIF